MSAALHSLSAIGEQLAPTAPPATRIDDDMLSVLDEIRQLIGLKAAVALVQAFGGRRIYVPMQIARGDLLAREIGVGLAKKLSRVFGGDRIDVPTDLDFARRRARIALMRRRGMTHAAIARTLHCTERYVYKVLAKERPDRAAETIATSVDRGS
jgi:Mor family transcriptional regulator